MANRILNKRLQDQRRHRQIEHRSIGMNLYRESLTESAFLDAYVKIKDLQLARKRNLVRLHLIKRHSQQLTQTKKNVFCRRRVLLDERNRRLQRVEQKMRLQLNTQPLKIGRGYRGLNMRPVNLALPGLLPSMKQTGGNDDGEVNDDRYSSANSNPLRHQLEWGSRQFVMKCVEPSSNAPCESLSKETSGAGYRVGKEDVPAPVGPNYRIALSKLKNQGSQRHHDEPVERCPGNVMQSGHRAPHRSIAGVNLACFQEDQRAPEEHGQCKLPQIALATGQLRPEHRIRKFGRVLHTPPARSLVCPTMGRHGNIPLQSLHYDSPRAANHSPHQIPHRPISIGSRHTFRLPSLQ